MRNTQKLKLQFYQVPKSWKFSSVHRNRLFRDEIKSYCKLYFLKSIKLIPFKIQASEHKLFLLWHAVLFTRSDFDQNSCVCILGLGCMNNDLLISLSLHYHEIWRIIAAKGFPCSYIWFHKDVKTLSTWSIAKYRDFTWGKFEPFAALWRGNRCS